MSARNARTERASASGSRLALLSGISRGFAPSLCKRLSGRFIDRRRGGDDGVPALDHGRDQRSAETDERGREEPTIRTRCAATVRLSGAAGQGSPRTSPASAMS